MDKQEYWIRDSIKEQKIEQPSVDFTDNVMLAIQQNKLTETSPLISKNGWLLIGTFVLLILVLCVFASAQITYHITPLNFKFPIVKISPFVSFILVVAAALVFVQTALIKKYFNQTISW